MALARLHRSIFVTRPARRPRATCRLAVEPLEARDNPSGGTLDPTFGTGGIVTSNFPSLTRVYDVLVQPDGKSVVVGTTPSTRPRGAGDFLVARYNANGTPDGTFGTGGHTSTDLLGDDLAKAVAVQPNTGGKILVAGISNDSKTNSPFFALARYNPNGSLDTSFGQTGKQGVGYVTTKLGSGSQEWAMAVQPDGRIILAGVVYGTAGGTVLGLVRYTAGGALDPTFGSGGVVLTSLTAPASAGAGAGLHPAADRSCWWLPEVR
jgi:uncharacterized delta-60 repeat protein